MLKELQFYINNIIKIDSYAQQHYNNYKILIEEIYEEYKKYNIECDDYLNYNCEFKIDSNNWGCTNCKYCKCCRRCENCIDCLRCWECEKCEGCTDCDSCVNCKNCIDEIMKTN